MTAPAPTSPVHKRIVLAAAGCAVVLAAFAVVGLISVRKMGLEPPTRPRVATPALAMAAVDSLSRLDFSGWLTPAAAPAELRCRDVAMPDHVVPAPDADSVSLPIGFGDTFPPGSTARRMWEAFGQDVDLEPAEGRATPVESLPPGRELLAAVRVRLNRHDGIGACELLQAVIEKVRGLESDTQLDRVVAGVWLARDAASMVSRDSLLQAMTGLTAAQANALLTTLDGRRQLVLGIERLIDAAGAMPASVDSLMRWAQDGRLPLPVRRAFVAAIAYGWVDDPPEMTLGVNGARRAALETMLRGNLPDALRETAEAARQVLQGNLAQRFQFAVTYRARRDMQP